MLVKPGRAVHVLILFGFPAQSCPCPPYDLPISLRIGISFRAEKEQNRFIIELERLLYIRKSILRKQRRKSGGDRTGFAGDDTGAVQVTNTLYRDLIRAGKPCICLAEKDA